MAIISEKTVAYVEGVAAEAQRIETPCGDGSLVWRIWGSGPPLVLLHGGYGSWRHWVRNVIPLSRRFTVIACDMPGLGDSATPPEPWTADGLAAIVVAGLDIVLPTRVAPHLAGFSFGGVIGGVVAAQLGDRLKAFTVVGSNGMGLERQPTPLERVKPDASEEEEFATHRYNLNQLMIHDPAKIDELALYLQKTNHARARMRSRRFSRSGALIEALPESRAGSTASGASATPPPIRMSRSASACCKASSPAPASPSSRAPAIGSSSRPPTPSTASSPNTRRARAKRAHGIVTSPPAGSDPRVHVLIRGDQDVDGRAKPGQGVRRGAGKPLLPGSCPDVFRASTSLPASPRR